MGRQWRAPIEADKGRKCRARNEYEKKPFYVVWNKEYKTWCLDSANHILVRVKEVLEPRERA